MQLKTWCKVSVAAIFAFAPVAIVPVAGHAQPASAAAQDQAWFHGMWRIKYDDAVLGPVEGAAAVTDGKQGLDVRIRLQDPRNGEYRDLKSASSRLDGETLELKLQGSSPASGFSELAGPTAARVLRVPAGKQLQARMKDASPAYAHVSRAAPPLVDPYLTLRVPLVAGPRETLMPEWTYAISRPGDMASNRAGEVVERAGKRLARGLETWMRLDPVIAMVTDVDLHASKHAALESRWGPDTDAVTWLRVSGTHLPVQPRRVVKVSFEDPGIVWTGELRPSPASPEALDLRVQVLKGVSAGPKWFTLNGAAGRWDYGIEPVGIRHLRPLSAPDAKPAADLDAPRFENAEELFIGEVFLVEVEYASEPAFTSRSFASRVRDGVPVLYEITKDPDRKTVFRSGPILLDDGATADPEAEEGSAPMQPVVARIPASAETTLRTEEPEALAPSTGHRVGLASVLARPESLWNEAMKKAAACRRSGRTPGALSRRIVREGFAKRSLAISHEDHAAALLLRDELVLELERFAARERRALARGGALQTAYTAQAISEARKLSPSPMATIEVRTPDNQEVVPLRTALSPEMESRTFKRDQQAFFVYAQQAVAAARRELADRAQAAAITAGAVDDCDVERMLGTVRAGLGPVVANLQKRLLRPPRGGEPSIPRWVPDRKARSHVGSLGTLAEAVKAQNEYSSLDTQWVITMATAATAGVGGAAGGVGWVSKEFGGKSLGKALGTVASDAAGYGVALDVADLGLTLNDFAEYGEALDEIAFAEGLAAIGGENRLKEARLAAENKAFGLIVQSGALAGSGAVAASHVTRTATEAPDGVATAGGASPPGPPAAAAAATPGAIPASAAETPRVAAAEPAPMPAPATGGLLDRPEFRNLPDKPPAESPDLESFMTPEELAARPPGVAGSTGAPASEPTGSATTATILEPGREPRTQSDSASTGPTGTYIDPARKQPEATNAAGADPEGDFSIDLSAPDATARIDQRIDVARKGDDAEVVEPADSGILGRPEFRDIPRKPAGEPPDLDSYRTPEERAARERLIHADTADLPAATPDGPATADVSSSRIERAQGETLVIPEGVDTARTVSAANAEPATPRPAEFEDRLAGPDEDTGVMPAMPGSGTSSPGSRQQPEVPRSAEWDEPTTVLPVMPGSGTSSPGSRQQPEVPRSAEWDEPTAVLPAMPGSGTSSPGSRQQPDAPGPAGPEDRYAGPDEDTSVMPSVPDTRTSSTPRPRPDPRPTAAQRIDKSTADRYFVVDSSNPRFVANAEVNDIRGELSIEIRTVLEDGTRSEVLRGADEFREILNHFRGQFTKIKGNWQYGSNLAKVNELTGPPHNLSLNEAVTKTWTADRAREAGYPNVLYVKGNGAPGHYTEVQAIFGQ